MKFLMSSDSSEYLHPVVFCIIVDQPLVVSQHFCSTTQANIHTHSLQMYYCVVFSLHSYTIVESFETFWVMQPSPDNLLGRAQPLPGNELFIKIHGTSYTQKNNTSIFSVSLQALLWQLHGVY